MTIGGLIKHLALCEDSKTAHFVTGEALGSPWKSVEDPWEWGWKSSAGDTPDELYGLWAAAVDRSRVAWKQVLAEGGVDQPSAHKTRDGESPNLRRILVDLHDEYARHVGHVDLMREAIDGVVGEDPPQN
jgi:hypothetical protein